MIYSDWDMILLQLVMERITGKTLDVLANEKIFKPLGMIDTQFQPPIAIRSRIAPTQVDDARGGLLWGTVHDENAWAMGGVAGHAGLFSTAKDLALFSMMILNGGEGVNGVRIVKPPTIARWFIRLVAITGSQSRSPQLERRPPWASSRAHGRARVRPTSSWNLLSLRRPTRPT